MKFQRNRLLYLTIFLCLIIFETMLYLFSSNVSQNIALFLNKVFFSMIFFLAIAFVLNKIKARYIAFFVLICIFSLEFFRIFYFIPILGEGFIGDIVYRKSFSVTSLLYFTFGLCISVFIDIFLVNKYFLENVHIKNKIASKFVATGVFFLCIMSITAFAFSNKINTAYYTIEIPNLPQELKGIKIAHLSDTHGTIYPEGSESLIEKIKVENPDVIFHTGDMDDENTSFDGSAILLEGIKDVAPIYYCVGNHEFWSWDFWDINEEIKSHGVIALENENMIINVNGIDVQLSGVDDPDGVDVRPEHKTIEENLQEMNENETDAEIEILLSHRPEIVDLYSQYDYDVILSGHAHGGQARIPFILNGLYAPNQGFFPKYAGGVYKIDSQNPNGTQMVVSRGLSIGRLPRVFNPPELVIITLA